MTATLTKPLKRGVKTIVGQVISRGLGVITLTVLDTKGGKSIKRFKESDYAVHIMTSLEQKISKVFNGAGVTDVIIDDEFNCVTATVDGRTNTDCGWLEDYTVL